MVPDGAHSYPDAASTAAEHTMFTVAVGAAVQALLVALAVRGVGSCWIGSTIFAADLVRAELDLPDDWEPLGAIAIGYPAEPAGPREPAPTDGLLVRKMSLHESDGRGADRLAGARPRAGHAAARGAGVRGSAARTRASRECVPGPHHGVRAGARPHRNARPADAAPSVRPLAAARRALRGQRRRHRRRRAARGIRGVGHRRPAIDPNMAALHVHPVTCSLGVPTRHLDLQFVAPCSAGRRNRLQRRIIGPALVAARRASGGHRLRAGRSCA